MKRLHDTTVDVVVDGKATTKPLIDGVGFQGHMLGGKDPRPDISDIETNLQLDVRIRVVNGVAAVADLDRQRLVFNTMTQVITRKASPDLAQPHP